MSDTVHFQSEASSVLTSSTKAQHEKDESDGYVLKPHFALFSGDSPKPQNKITILGSGSLGSEM